jgi:DNA polymerase-3 subunit epsilon
MNWLTRIWWKHKFKESPYAHLFEPHRGEEYVALDCETTSLDPLHAELVSIAATKIVGNRVLTSQPFEIKLLPPDSLAEDSVKVHQIRHQDLVQGATEEEALDALISFIGNRPIVGYHIRYDKKILDLACIKHKGFPLPNRIIEVADIYHDKLEQQLPNGYFDLSMDAICRHLDIPITNKHNALADAIVAALIYVRLTHGSFPTFAHSTYPSK